MSAFSIRDSRIENSSDNLYVKQTKREGESRSGLLARRVSIANQPVTPGFRVSTSLRPE